jgi:hypothetical protein
MRNLLLNAATVVATLLAAQTAGASMLYLSDGDGRRMLAVDTNTGAVVNSWAANPSQRAFPIAISGDIRTTGYAPGETGGQYSLAGASLGGTYALPSGDTMSDGTTDGSYNYGMAWADGDVYRFDRNWANPELLFGTGSRQGGISYDTSNGTMWTSCDRCAGLQNYSMTGTLLGTIATAAQSSNLDWNLAYDPSDDSLWVGEAFSSRLFHYSANGNYLGSITLATRAASFFSGEFNLPSGSTPGNGVPEPAALGLAGLGLMALALTRRRAKAA